jgi:mannose/fructose/N-acetylgalactosamine-specific phosphotransferase system component IIC
MKYSELFSSFTVEQSIYLLYWVAGIATHWGMKLQREGVTARQYWASKPLNSMASILVSFAVVLNSLLAGDNEFMTYFGAGFVAEAFINRYVATTQGGDPNVGKTESLR